MTETANPLIGRSIKKLCRAGRLKPSTEYERSTRRRYCDENGSAITFIRQHPYPNFEDMHQIAGTSPAFYTKEVRDQCEKVYNMVGTSTFKVYGRELGDWGASV